MTATGQHQRPVQSEQPLILYRGTVEPKVVAESLDKSHEYVLDIALDPQREGFTDLGCAPDGSVAAMAVSDAQTGKSRIVMSDDPEHPIQLDFRVQGLAWSPDGLTIAITALDPQVPIHKVLTLDRTTRELEELTIGAGVVGMPRWSPDGTRVVYDVGNKGPNQVYVLTIGEFAPVKITERELGAFFPDWSPDGQTLAFAGQGSDAVSQIYSVPASGGAMTQLTSSPRSKTMPRFSPDGSRIAFVGTTLTPMTSAHPPLLHQGGILTSAADGSDEQQFTEPTVDAWLIGWCNPGPWMQQIGVQAPAS